MKVYLNVCFCEEKIADYSLKIISHTGEVFEIKDPYSYGKMIDEFDLQLWGKEIIKKPMILWVLTQKK